MDVHMMFIWFNHLDSKQMRNPFQQNTADVESVYRYVRG